MFSMLGMGIVGGWGEGAEHYLHFDPFLHLQSHHSTRNACLYTQSMCTSWRVIQLHYS